MTTTPAPARSHDALFTPLQIGGVQLPNRFILCAMEGTNLIGGETRYEFNESCREFYLERANAGVGLMIPGMVGIRGYMGNKWLYQCERLFMGPVKDLMEQIHRHGARLFLQVGAGMGRSMTPVPVVESLYHSKVRRSLAKLAGFDVQRLFAAPSAGLPDVWDPSITTSELSRSDIAEMVDAYGRTAALCRRAGIDGLEIHAIHEGYLLDQFATAATNHRNDEYGGSLENRLRFTTDIIGAIKKACGDDFPVSVRFSVESKMLGFGVGAVPGEEHTEFGRDRTEAVQAARILQDAGADLLNADNGTYDSWFWAHPPVYMPPACNLDDVAYLKQHVDIPVACAGRMEDPDTAADAVASGRIDAVGIARQFLADGQYVAKVREGRLADIRPCIACHNGCFGVYHYKGLAADMPSTPLGHCALNPATLQEDRYRIRPAEHPKRVAVIGGGIGGMEVARLCALRGHRVTLYERSGELGGVFTAAAAPSFKEKDRQLLTWYRRQVDRLPIEVRLNTDVGPQDLPGLEAEEVVVATGARPRPLPIPGLEAAIAAGRAMEAIAYLNGDQEPGERVVVLGGGLTGCEIAYDLALKGRHPHIVEMQDDILKVKNLSAANSNMLRELIRHHRIPVDVDARVSAVDEDGVTIETPSGRRVLEADSVIVSAGYLPGAALAEHGGAHVHVVGDAAAVGNLKDVVWGAYELALAL